nr:hypothetical protein [Candidatus Sigynarchaeota archaeon]
MRRTSARLIVVAAFIVVTFAAIQRGQAALFSRGAASRRNDATFGDVTGTDAIETSTPPGNYTMVTTTYSWQSTSGATSLQLSDDGASLESLPFAFRFYDANFTSIYVCSNGYMSFMDGSGYTHGSIPSTGTGYRFVIAPFWDDLYPASAGGSGSVLVRSFGTYWVATWSGIRHFSTGPTVGTFQVVLAQTGVITFNYDYLSYTSGGAYTCGLNYGLIARYYTSYAGLTSSTNNLSLRFTPAVTNVAPVLSSVSVSPTSGNRNTLFNYRVTYTDANNDAPAYVSLYINGTQHNMSKVDANDFTFTDGCVYQYITYLDVASYAYSFSCSDGTAIATIAAVTGPTVNTSTSNYAPMFLQTSVSPSTGYHESTIFTFKAKYQDSDNDRPQFMNVTLNWWATAMTKEDPADFNYTDGCFYVYSTTLSAAWNYTLSFACSDGTYTASSSGCPPPVVTMPAATWNQTWKGDNSRDFGNGVYCDGNNVYTCGTTTTATSGPYDILIVKWDLEGNQVWNRTWGGPATEYAEDVWSDGGDIYVTGYTSSFGGSYEVLLLKWTSNGDFVYNKTWGGISVDEGHDITGDASSVYVTGYTCSFNSWGYSDVLLLKWSKSGTLDFYRYWGVDNCNDQGYGIWCDATNVYITGSTGSYGCGSYDVVLVKWSKTGIFKFFRTWGGSNYELGYDIWGTGSLLCVTGFTNSLGQGANDAILVQWDTNGTFYYYTTWGGTGYDVGMGIWCDGGADQSIYISGYTNSAGAGSYDMFTAKFYLNGTLQYCKTWGDRYENYGESLSGFSNQLYICGLSATGNEMIIVKRNTDPGNLTLTTPVSGTTIHQNTPAIFTWESAASARGNVNYTLQISNSSTFGTIMAQFTTISSSTYSISSISYPTGRYYWRVRADRGSYVGNWYSPAALTISPPNALPVLSSPSVAPANGSQRMTYAFNITYTDANNDAPASIKVRIGSTVISMAKYNTSDHTYTDGCVYTGSTKLPVNIYTHWFEASDGHGTVNTTTCSGPTVLYTDVVPVLSFAGVTPSSGYTETTFTFYVTYSHAENIAPTQVELHFGYNTYWMNKENGSDTCYTDGCNYSYTMSFPSGYASAYHFMTSDGYEVVETGLFSPPTIAGSVASLSGFSISPESGSTTTQFFFSIIYTNLNNVGPSYISLIIDSARYTMSKDYPADTDYTDGCTYSLYWSLPAGYHVIYVTCIDLNGHEAQSYVQTITVQGTDINSPAAGFTAAMIVVGVFLTISISIAAHNIKVKKTGPASASSTTYTGTGGARPFPSRSPASGSGTRPSGGTPAITTRSLLPESAFVPQPLPLPDPAMTRPALQPASSSTPVTPPAPMEVLPGSPKWQRLARFDISQYSTPQVPPSNEDESGNAPDVNDGIRTSSRTTRPEVANNSELGSRQSSPAIFSSEEREGTNGDNHVDVLHMQEPENGLEEGRSMPDVLVTGEDSTENTTDNKKVREKEEPLLATGEMQEQIKGAIEDISQNKVLRVTQADFHAGIEKSQVTPRVVTFSCTTCNVQVTIHDIDPAIIYHCKVCGKPLDLMYECPICSEKMTVKQDSLAIVSPHRVQCETCWEEQTA